MVVAHDAFAGLCAGHSELETLAVAFTASRSLASATLAMLHGLFVAAELQLFHEGQRVALADICLRCCDGGLLSCFIVAVGAAAVDAAELALGEALAVELEAA